MLEMEFLSIMDGIKWELMGFFLFFFLREKKKDGVTSVSVCFWILAGDELREE